MPGGDMTYLGWLLLGFFVSIVNVKSISRMVSHLHERSSLWKVGLSYSFRFIFTGMFIFLALQYGASQALVVFLGILIFRWSLLIPAFRRLFYI